MRKDGPSTRPLALPNRSATRWLEVRGSEATGEDENEPVVRSARVKVEELAARRTRLPVGKNSKMTRVKKPERDAA